MDWIKFFQTNMREAAAKILEIYLSEKRQVEVGIGQGGDRTLVADKASEDIIIKRLRNTRLDVRLISEEQGEIIIGKKPQYTVFLDPLDGSFNFKTGIDYYALSMAVMDNHSGFIAGYVMDVPQAIEYYANEEGAYKNGVKISTSDSRNANRVLLECAKGGNPDDLGLISRTIMRSRHIRAPGAVALDLCRVADGSFDCLLYSGATRFLDVAAGIYILENAGGMVSDFEGNRAVREGDQLVAKNILATGNRHIHERVLDSGEYSTQ